MVFSKRILLTILIISSLIHAAQNPIYQSATIRPGFTHRAMWNYKHVGAILDWADFTSDGKQIGYTHLVESHTNHFFGQIAFGIKDRVELSFTPLHIEPGFGDFIFNFFAHYHWGVKVNLMKTELPFEGFNQLSLSTFLDIGVRGGYAGLALSMDRPLGSRSNLEFSFYPSFNVHRYFYFELPYSVKQNSLDIPLGIQYSFGRVVKLSINAGVAYSIEIGDYSYTREDIWDEKEVIRWTHKSSPLCFTAGVSIYVGSKRVRRGLSKEK